jgi:hypothetical protein
MSAVEYMVVSKHDINLKGKGLLHRSLQNHGN